tara:strand:+ start:143 stop:307 length:165 start_codon:yes stop_codon:yes gene_type:complete
MSKYTDRLLTAVHEIAGLIYYQAPFEEQDRWLAEIVEAGLWEVPEDEGGFNGYQ